MPYRAVIFDLDGTLADTLADIAHAANFALAEVGRPPHPVDRYRTLAGQGVDHLIAHALKPGGEHAEGVRTPAGNASEIDPAPDESLIARTKALYLARYDAHKYDRTAPFPGIAELLDALTARGLKLAVLSNKPHEPTLDMMTHLFARWRFEGVVGAKPGAPLKPAPGAALAVADTLGVPPTECVYVGDTRADMLTGRGAGMFTVGVLWGFRDEAELRASGADAIIAHPMELMALMDARV